MIAKGRFSFACDEKSSLLGLIRGILDSYSLLLLCRVVAAGLGIFFFLYDGGLVFSLDFFLEFWAAHHAEFCVCCSKVELLNDSGLSGVVMERGRCNVVDDFV